MEIEVKLLKIMNKRQLLSIEERIALLEKPHENGPEVY